MGHHIYAEDQSGQPIEIPWVRVPSTIEGSFEGTEAALRLLEDLWAKRWPCRARGVPAGALAADHEEAIRRSGPGCCSTPCVVAYDFSLPGSREALDEVEAVCWRPDFGRLEVG